jgi:cobalt-precorrin-5B (C1)-methyltransferase
MKKPRGTLRTGYTTGTCAAAAAKGAALMLAGEKKTVVDITLPAGETIRITAERVGFKGNAAFCEVKKDAGDDPDITNGALIQAAITPIDANKLVILRGEGVGLVTRPGLAVPPGKPAINLVPEKMITDSVTEVLGYAHGAEITISVADGAELAKQTLNPRLGIVGGISILGTTGLVIPYSHEAYRESIRCALDVVCAMGIDHAVFCTGRSSEKEAQQHFNSLPEAAFILMGDYFGYAVQEAVRHGIRHISIAGFPGKVLKMAMGAACTHYSSASIDLSFLADCAVKTGVPQKTVRAIEHAHTARHAVLIIPRYYQQQLFAYLAQLISDSVIAIAGTSITTDILVVSYAGGVLFYEG